MHTLYALYMQACVYVHTIYIYSKAKKAFSFSQGFVAKGSFPVVF